MAAGCGQDDGVQQVPLPFYLRKVRGAAENALLFCLFADASFYPPALKQAHGIIECMEAVYLDTTDLLCLTEVGGRHTCHPDPALSRCCDHRKNASTWADPAVKG